MPSKPERSGHPGRRTAQNDSATLRAGNCTVVDDARVPLGPEIAERSVDRHPDLHGFPVHLDDSEGHAAALLHPDDRGPVRCHQLVRGASLPRSSLNLVSGGTRAISFAR